MLFCQLGRAHSLREIEQRLKSGEAFASGDRGSVEVDAVLHESASAVAAL